jgi:SAM-dependent methyltransferase
MTDAGPNAAQTAYWNETAGPLWVAMQDHRDAELRHFGLAAMEALGPRGGERLIDIGCGCGATTLELARRVGSTGAVLGADLSKPMLAVAEQRARDQRLDNAAFLQADAQVCAFAPADGAFSRFGVMFFEDPVAAFANIRRALAPNGRLAFVCWRALADNPWVTIPLAAVVAVAPTPPAATPANAPGPFALADKSRLATILKDAGYRDIAIEPYDRSVEWGDLETSVEVALGLGPIGAIVRQHPQLRERFTDEVRAALTAHLTADGVKLGAAVWIVRATA